MDRSKGFASTFLLMVVSLVLLLSGCTPILDFYFRKTLPPRDGVLAMEGVEETVTVRRDDLGIPLIDARSLNDCVFAAGYANAADRLAQMTGLKLIAQGRLSEMMGEAALDIDIYMRSFGFQRAARVAFESASPRTKELLRRYSAGVNAYIETHRHGLPPEFLLSDYTPDPWEPIDSASIFLLVTFGLGFNLREEIDFLNIAARIGPEKAAWLFPIYPDEPLPFEEAEKLAGIHLSRDNSVPDTRVTERMVPFPALSGIPASNNWAVSPSRTAGGASLFANDTHLPVYLPSLWNMMHLRCPEYDAAGIAIAGVPGIVAGYNGHLAWGMTMVMADNQDLFLEQTKHIDGKLHYLYRNDWVPTDERKEFFFIRRNDEPVTKTIHETVHGPLIGDSLPSVRKLELQTQGTPVPFGLALSWPIFEADRSMDAFLSLGTARSVTEALSIMRDIRIIPLNMVCADPDNIGWQVTGRYPVRKKGRGLLPSPGWTGDFDWTGFLPVDSHPSLLNPPQGFIFSANHRTVPADHPVTLSSSWYWPERGERIAQILKASTGHTFRSCIEMQRDVYSLFVPKLKRVFLSVPFHDELLREIDRLPGQAQREKALEALAMLQRFDGTMSVDSSDASIVGALIHTATRNTFLDELGPEDSLSWQSFLDTGNIGYCAQYDHLTVRGDESPFWDDITTEPRERKAAIIARSLADAIDMLEKELGRNRGKWKWGTLHTCRWDTESTRLAPFMDLPSRIGLRLLSPYLNRGPYPVPGDYMTLNVSGYHTARDFNTWLIPEMRIIVDFSLDEPFMAMNSTGQSGNPASPHYDDAITLFLEGRYQSFPFKDDHIRAQYTRLMTLRPLH